jgi:hypothetical protein
MQSFASKATRHVIEEGWGTTGVTETWPTPDHFKFVRVCRKALYFPFPKSRMETMKYRWEWYMTFSDLVTKIF